MAQALVFNSYDSSLAGGLAGGKAFCDASSGCALLFGVEVFEE